MDNSFGIDSKSMDWVKMVDTNNIRLSRKGPGKLTDLVKHLLLFMFLIVLVDGSERSSRCDGMKVSYGKQGYLSRKDRSDYCFHGCDFLKHVECEESGEKFSLMDTIYGLSSKALDGSINFDQYPVELPDAVTIEAWTEILMRVWPAGIAVVIVILNQWRFYHFWAGIVCTFMFIILHFVTNCGAAMTSHNIAIALLCAISGTNATYLVDAIWTLIVMEGVICSLFFLDYAAQVGVLVLTILLGFCYLYFAFYIRRSGSNAGMVIVFLQLWVLMEQLHYARTNMFNKTLASAGLEMMLGTIYPDGNSRFYVFNAGHAAGEVVKRMPTFYPKTMLIILFFFQIGFFCLFRACLGAYYLIQLRYKFEIGNLMIGWYVYQCDFFGPFICALRILTCREPISFRRVFYAGVGISLCVMECLHAYGYVLFRISWAILNLLFFDSKYVKTPHYLAHNVDFALQAFSHYDALPWVSLTELTHIAKYTGTLVSQSASRTVRGVGVVLKSGGRSMLYTVSHVVHNTRLVQFGGQSIAEPHFEHITSGGDPVVAMKIEGFNDAPEVDLITHEECVFIKYLAFINSNSEGGDEERFISFVPKFHMKGNNLYASVNLKHGDSGGPCFAILETGAVRLCGVVSAGNPRSGGGNIISFVVHDGDIGANSSDEDELGAVQQFNAVRRVKFASEDAENNRWAASLRLSKWLEMRRETLESAKPWPVKMSYAERDMLAEQVAERLLTGGNEEYFKTLRENREEEPDRGERGKGGKQPKSWKKDRAAQKRAAMEYVLTMQNLATKLNMVLSEEASQNVFNAVAAGSVPTINDRAHIANADGQYWIFSDSPVDPKWS